MTNHDTVGSLEIHQKWVLDCEHLKKSGGRFKRNTTNSLQNAFRLSKVLEGWHWNHKLSKNKNRAIPGISICVGCIPIPMAGVSFTLRLLFRRCACFGRHRTHGAKKFVLVHRPLKAEKSSKRSRVYGCVKNPGLLKHLQSLMFTKPTFVVSTMHVTDWVKKPWCSQQSSLLLYTLLYDIIRQKNANCNCSSKIHPFGDWDFWIAKKSHISRWSTWGSFGECDKECQWRLRIIKCRRGFFWGEACATGSKMVSWLVMTHPSYLDIFLQFLSTVLAIRLANSVTSYEFTSSHRLR